MGGNVEGWSARDDEKIWREGNAVLNTDKKKINDMMQGDAHQRQKNAAAIASRIMCGGNLRVEIIGTYNNMAEYAWVTLLTYLSSLSYVLY